MVEVMKVMRLPSKGPLHTLLHSVLPTLQQATADPRLCQRLLDIDINIQLLKISGLT